MKKVKKLAMIVGVLAITVGFVISLYNRSIKEKPVLYTLSIGKPVAAPNPEFFAAHSYLQELQVLQHVGVPYKETKVARSEKTLDSLTFVALVDELVKNGFILYGMRFSEINITKRIINEDEQHIIITDRGEVSESGDLTLETSKGNGVLQYRYEKHSGNIYFTAISKW